MSPMDENKEDFSGFTVRRRRKDVIHTWSYLLCKLQNLHVCCRMRVEGKKKQFWVCVCVLGVLGAALRCRLAMLRSLAAV